MNKHFQHQPKPYNQNNRFHSGKTDPILTLVAMVLCGLAVGRAGWSGNGTQAFCCSLAWVQPACFPPSPSTPQQLAAAYICWPGAAARLQPLQPLWFGSHGGSMIPQASRPVSCRPQLPSFGCLPLYWKSLYLPARGLWARSLSSSLTSCHPAILLYSLQKRNSLQYF